MRITLEDYIKNPSGGRARIVGEQEIAKNVFNDAFNKLMLKVGGNINHVMYKDDENRFLIHAKIPSTTIDKLFYDVVIEFTATEKSQTMLPTLNSYYVRFFSNDPNFIFTYAYVFKRKGLLIPELEFKISPKALRDKPKTTNPNTTVGYVKSIYFLYLFIKSRGYDRRLMWTTYSIPYKPNALKERIATSDQKMIEVESLKSITRSAKKLGTNASRDIANTKTYDDLQQVAKAYSNKSNLVTKTRRVESSIRGTTRTKTTRRIGK